MTPEEQSDLDIMKGKIHDIKIQTYDYMRYLARYSEQELLQSGHRKGNAQALLDTFNKSQRDIQKLQDDFVRKYPD